MGRKRGRKKPTFDGIQIKVDRAKFHLEELNGEIWKLFPEGNYVIVPELYDDDTRHVFRAQDPPIAEPRWGAIIGDCVHNLRSALDHLVYQLAQSPDIGTQFPIRDRPDRDRTWFAPWRSQVSLPKISGGVNDNIRKVIEVVQPYNRRDVNHGLGLLRDLDNIDKHRTLLVAVGATGSHVTSWWEGSPDAPPPFKTQFTRKPLEHGEVMAVVVYERPYRQPDPNLKFVPHIAFDRGGPVAGQYVLGVLTDLSVHVEDDVLPMFKQFFPAT